MNPRGVKPILDAVGAWTLLWISTTANISLAQTPDYSDELPRIAPTSPSDSLDTFNVADRFQMQLVASEPLLGSPVAIEWDADGAMFVCEMRGYSENRDDRISRIARLVDTDGDGVYDHRTEFAEGLYWPTAIFPFDGGLFVGDAPDLFYFKDTTGDGTADLRRRVMTGFGTSNVQGLLNSFRWGLDNRIHVACSSVGGSIQRVDPVTDEPLAANPLNIRGRDISFDPRSYHFQLTSGAAQHGMCFDDWGRKFVSSNSDHIQQVMYEDRYVARNPFVLPPPARVSIAEDGPQAEVFRTSPVEPWRIVRTRLRVSGLAKGPIEGGGRAAGYFTGATGITIYRGDVWPASMRGMAIVGDVGGNLIHRKQIDQTGLQFVAKRIDKDVEFVSSDDIWFRPAQFANAPDGSLHVVDVYREVIEHPNSLPAEIKQHLDLTAGKNRGRIYRLVPADFQARTPMPLKSLTTTELVTLLTHRNAWHRETASRLIFERQDAAAIEPLRQLATDGHTPLGRMHAIYALDGLNSLTADDLRLRLADEHPQVRVSALKLAERVAYNEALGNAISELVHDPSIEVRYQLAFTAGSVPLADRVSVLRDLLRQDMSNRWVRFAVLTSLVEDASEMQTQLKGSELADTSDGKRVIEDIQKLIASQNRHRDTAVEKGESTMGTTETTQATAAATAQRQQRQQIVSRYRDVLELSTEIDRGKQMFVKHCSSCHRLDEVGHPLGPNLATMKNRGPETILVNVLDPNREVNPQYIEYIASTFDGRIVSGMISEEGTTSITLQKAGAESETLLRVDIDQFRSKGVSLMPDGFEELMSKQDLADLIAYLMQAN